MAEQLQDLPDVAVLSPRVIRILGQNPGKFTLQGTNTYLISSPLASSSSSSSIPSILIDAAEGEEAYFPVLEKILTGQDPDVGAQKRHITDIILTHWHQDHVQGLPSLLQGLAKLRREGASPGPAPRIRKYVNADQDPAITESIADLSPASDYYDTSHETALQPIDDNETLKIGESSSLRALHTPGHTTDHLSFLLEEERVLFSGDNVLGQGTSVFEDLGAYLSSLDRSLEVLKEAGPASATGQENLIYPAHGPVIEKGRETIKTYVGHRLEREKQVLELLGRQSPSDTKTEDSSATSTWTIMEIVQKLYANYPESLYPAAGRGIFLHLHKLASEGRVKCSGELAGADGAPPPVSPLKMEYMTDMTWGLNGNSRL